MMKVVGLVLSLLVCIGYVHCILDAASLEGHILAAFSNSSDEVTSNLSLINVTTGLPSAQWTLNPPMFNSRIYSDYVLTTYDSSITSYCYGFYNQTQVYCLNVLNSRTVTVTIPEISSNTNTTKIYALTSSGGILYGIKGYKASVLQYFSVNITTGVARIYATYKFQQGIQFNSGGAALYANINGVNYLFYTAWTPVGDTYWVEVDLDTGVTSVKNSEDCESGYYKYLQYSGGQIYGGIFYEVDLIVRTKDCPDRTVLWSTGSGTYRYSLALNAQKSLVYGYAPSYAPGYTGFYAYNWRSNSTNYIQNGNALVNSTNWQIIL